MVAGRDVSTVTYKSVTKIPNQLQLGNKPKEKGNMATTSERGSTERELLQRTSERRSHRMVGERIRLHRGSSGTI
jgi:hypothetical protein